MFKARSILAAIVVLVIISGAFVVKASKGSRTLHTFFSLDPVSGNCTVPFQTFYTTINGTLLVPWSTTPKTGSFYPTLRVRADF